MNTLIIIAILLIASLKVSGTIWPNSKIIFTLAVGVMIFYIGGYNGNLDFPVYQARYDNRIVSERYIENLYNIIARFFSIKGIKFEYFHMFLSTICIVIIAFVIIRLSGNKAFVITGLIGFATVEYGILLTTLCASALISLSVYFFIESRFKERKKIYVIKSIICLVLSCGFHFLSFFLFIMYFFPFMKKENIKQIILVLVVVLLVILPYLFRYIVWIAGSAVSYYLNHSTPWYVVVLMVLWQIAGVYIIHRIYNRYLVKLTNHQETVIVETIYILSFTLLLIVPLYLYTNLVIRVIRIFFIFYFILISYVKTPYLKLSKDVIIWNLYNMASLFVFYVIIPSDLSKGVIIEILTSNIFFK